MLGKMTHASQQNRLVNEAGMLVYPIIKLAQTVATSKWPILTIN